MSATGDLIVAKLAELNELCRDYLGEANAARMASDDSTQNRYGGLNKLRMYIVGGLPALYFQGASPALPSFAEVNRYFRVPRTPL